MLSQEAMLGAGATARSCEACDGNREPGFGYELIPPDDPKYALAKKRRLEDLRDLYFSEMKKLDGLPEMSRSCGLDVREGRELEGFVKVCERFYEDYVEFDLPVPMSEKIGYLTRGYEETVAVVEEKIDPLKKTLGQKAVDDLLYWFEVNVHRHMFHAAGRLCELELFREPRERRRTVVMPLLAAKGWTPGKWITEAAVTKNSGYGYLDGTRKISDQVREDLAAALGIKPEDLPE